MVFLGALIAIVVISGSLALTDYWAVSESKSETETVEVTDMLGRTVRIPREVDEVVGVEAGALRLLTYIGATDMVVGVEEFEKRDHIGRPYILAHPELLGLPSIGPIHGGNPELIASQDPDVVFLTYTTVGEANDLQQKIGVPVIALDYGDLSLDRNDFYESLKVLGNILDKEESAKELISFINDTIRDLDERTKNIPPESKPSVYVGGIGYKGTHGIVSTEPDYEPFSFVNARNVASGLGVDHAMIDGEKLIQWDPDVLFVDEGGYLLVKEDLKEPEYRSMEAVKNDNIYGLLPYNYYTANFGTILANSYYVGKVLYERSFEDVIPRDKADEIYKMFVGKPVYENMEESLGGFKKIPI